MSSSILTKRMKAFIRSNITKMSRKKMAKHFEVTDGVIYRYCKKEGIIVPKEQSEAFKVAGMIGRTSFTKEEDLKIKNEYLSRPIKVIAAEINRSYTGVMGRLKVMGLQIPEQLRLERKYNNSFKSGHTPLNKGRKQSEYMSTDAIERTKATRFKKGDLPHNTKRDLEITIRKDNRGVKLKFIRVGLGKWVPLQRYNWEKQHGPIPAGMKIIFKNGDCMNCDVSNLEIVSTAELMKRNSYHNNYPKSVGKVIQLRGVLNRQINKHLKKMNNEK